MPSPNISFENLPSSIRKPGKYFEFNTKLAVRTLPGNSQEVLLLGQKLAAGSQPVLTPVDVFSDDQAIALFGKGSQLHLMVRAAIKANPYLQLTAIAVADPAGNAATGTTTIAGTATSSGVLSVWIANNRVDVPVSVGDTANVVAAALAAAINARPEIPVSSVAAAAVVTHTCYHKGTLGNDIKLSAASTAAGISATVVTLASGTLDPDYSAALAAVAGAGHHIIAAPLSSQAHLTALRTHLDFVSGPLEQRGAIGAFGWPGTLATGTTLAGQINSGRISGAWHRGSLCLPCEIAAAYAAVLASEEDPSRPLNTLPLASLDVTAITAQPMRTEQENALANGLTPLEVGPGDKVQIVRAITTYTKDPQGVNDVSLLDVTTIRTLDYVRKAVRERIALRFPREKLSERTPAKVRSEALDVLVKLEELEIVEAVEANKDGLLAERDSQDVNRLNLKIPCDVVNGLHVIAGRIDLLL